MDRKQYTEARRATRTFHTFCGLACAQAEAGDLDLLHSVERWCQAVYRPLNVDGRLAGIWASTLPCGSGFGPSIPLLRKDRAELRRWLSHFRLCRAGVVRRERCRLPA